MSNSRVMVLVAGLMLAGPVLADISFLTPPTTSGASGSGQALTSNTSRLQTDNRLYQARYSVSGNDWTGDLLEYIIPMDGIVTSAAVATATASAWATASAGANSSNRNIYTTNSSGNGSLFDNSYFVASSAASSALESYVRGAQPSGYRTRTSILGDILNSAPQYAGNLDFGYHQLSGTGTPDIGDDYVTYISSGLSKTRPGMVYVGANDGMLHGFRVDDSGTNNDQLEELLAFIPRTLEPKLASLASTSYTHQFYVDGTPRISDAHNGSDWKTVVVGTTAAGGRGLFALDITNPEAFVSGHVMWELDNQTAGFGALGYTLSQPSIVMLPDNTVTAETPRNDDNNAWAAVFGSGYDDLSSSPDFTGALYLVDLFSGSMIASLATGSTDGLSTPIVIDSTAKDAVPEMTGDIIYAGDLGGTLWKFYFDPSVTGNVQGWNKHVLFNTGSGQPITAKPQVINHPDGGFMVLFGTGRYFATGDELSVSPAPSPQVFYGIWDKDAGATVSVSDLQSQTILVEDELTFGTNTVTVRVTSDNKLTNSKLGWYFTLKNYDDGNTGKVFQERVVAEPAVRNSRVVFTTLIPDGTAFSGSGWLMELDALSGSRLSDVPIDLNGDGKFDEQDMVNVKNGAVVDGNRDLKNVSGVKSTDGLISSPNIISASNKEFKYLSKSTGEIETVVESTQGATFSKGRQSWQQIK